MNEVIQIKYGAQSAISRWFATYWTERDRRAAPWLLVVILLGFLILGPHTLLWLASLLPIDQLGNSGASIRSHQILLAIAGTLTTATCILVGRPFLKPTLIEATTEGLKRIWSFAPFHLRGKLLPFSTITSVRMVMPAGKTDTNSYQLCFDTASVSGAMKLELGELESDASRQAILTAISRATSATVSPEVFDLLMPKGALSFTELWLDALSAPPNRERLLPVSEGALIDTRYKIVKKLGAGGQGTVYLAEDANNENKQVVLKETILPVYTDLISRRQALEEFHKEAFALESVKSANIVSFLGSCVADHRAYLVLDYIKGTTLRDFVAAEGPLSTAKAMQLGMQMCDILSVLHSLSPPLIHRDFTPDNLILDNNGKLVLLDFAVAVAGDKDESDVAGKASYMAPEQFKGKPTIQSDVYSAGGTLSFILTGHHPDPLTESWPMLINSQVPQALNDVVTKATKYGAAERYSDAGAFKSDLQALV